MRRTKRRFVLISFIRMQGDGYFDIDPNKGALLNPGNSNSSSVVGAINPANRTQRPHLASHLRRIGVALVCLWSCSQGLGQSEPHATWRAYGGAEDGAQYSSLNQINRTNVARLKPVWTISTGDAGL